MSPPIQRLLLADDSAVVRRSIARRLTNESIEVVFAENAQEAAGIDPSTLDVAVVDLELGDADGTLTAERLIARNSRIRIAFFTSGSTAEVLTRARSLGPVFFKQDDLDALIEWIVASKSG